MGGLFFSVSSVSFQALFISLHLLIITLFQEGNIFGTNASLTYVLRYKDIHAFDYNNENYLQYVKSRGGVRTSSMLRAGYPTLLAWRGRCNYPGSRPAGVTTRCPILVTECLLTRSI